MTAIRAYAPFTLAELRSTWPQTPIDHAFAPDAAARGLTGDDLEEAEWLALSAAAAKAGETGAARAVLALDIDASTEQQLAPGLSLIRPTAATHVISAHVDEIDVVTRLAEHPESAQEILQEAGLLWYDVSELDELIDSLAEQPLDLPHNR